MQSKDEKAFIHNHLAFTVKYHKDVQTESARIVGFEVKPFRYLLLIPVLILLGHVFRNPVSRILIFFDD